MKSGLRILIRAPEVPFSVPPKYQKPPFWGVLGGPKKGTWGAQIKILRPIFDTNTPPKTPHLDTMGAVLESVNKMEQLVGMSKAKFGNSLK